MSYERSIKLAFDLVSQTTLDADTEFQKARNGFEIRRQSNHDEINLVCCQCSQRLNISTSKYDRLHFKHEPGSKFCILKDGGFSAKEIEEFNNVLKSKERPRHKELKNAIGSLIQKTDGFNCKTLSIDDKFIIIGDEKRKPDVYCEYQGKKIVFEIQLSKLSQRYLLDRHDFYTQNGIYLIWILDNFNVRDQSTFERDIKYLTEYQNFFSLDETTQKLCLICEYKFPFIKDDSEVHTIWKKTSVKFHDLKFDENSLQVYYFNYPYVLNQASEELNRIIGRNLEIEKEVKRQNAIEEVNTIISLIKTYHEKQYDFYTPLKRINGLDDLHISILNDKLQFSTTKSYAIQQYINSAKDGDTAFIRFLLSCYKINFDVHVIDTEGKSLLMVIYGKTCFTDSTKYSFILNLFFRGYNFQESDKEFLEAYFDDPHEREETIRLFKLFNILSPKTLVHEANRVKIVLMIIESAFADKIIGSKVSDWKAFANNAIHFHAKHWDYIELAFKKSGLFDKLINLDKKKTFQKKLEQFYQDIPDQDYDCDDVIQSLYPELYF